MTLEKQRPLISIGCCFCRMYSLRYKYDSHKIYHLEIPMWIRACSEAVVGYQERDGSSAELCAEALLLRITTLAAAPRRRQRPKNSRVPPIVRWKIWIGRIAGPESSWQGKDGFKNKGWPTIRKTLGVIGTLISGGALSIYGASANVTTSVAYLTLPHLQLVHTIL